MSLPSQSKYIVSNEACERFSFYGMKSILIVYMTSQLCMTDSAAVGIMHLFLAIIYLTPLIGAWLADKFLGRYNCILYISLFYCLGHGILALGDLTHDKGMQQAILFTGLGIIALGSGGIKPCVSAFVGDQMQGRSDKDMTRMYSAFYWSINLGSFFSFLIIPYLRNNYGYGIAFGIPGIFMGIATFIFWCGRRQYIHRIPTQPSYFPSLICRLRQGKEQALSLYGAEQMEQTSRTSRLILRGLIALPILAGLAYASYAGAGRLASLGWASEQISSVASSLSLFTFLILVLLLALYWAAKKKSSGFFGIAGHMLFNRQGLTQTYKPSERRDTRNLLRVLISFALVVPFWALFDQTGSSWILQAQSMIPYTIGSFTIGPEETQSFNPLLVMTFIPLLTLFIYPYIGKYSRPIRRIGIGICLAGLSYLSVAWLQSRLDGGEQLSILWQAIPYFLLTISEILVSTTGLEYAYTAAGKNLKSLVTSLWYLTITTANLLVVVLTSLVSDPASQSTFMLYSILTLVVGIIFIFITTRASFQPESEDEPLSAEN